jgi:hypothetical protein
VILIAPLLLLQSVEAVKDVELCSLRTETRLQDARQATYQRRDIWPDQYWFDARIGDWKLAQSFMRQHGYWAVASKDDSDLVFVVDRDGTVTFKKGDPAQGVRLACQASWISGVPFKSIDARSGTDLLYSVPAN